MRRRLLLVLAALTGAANCGVTTSHPAGAAHATHSAHTASTHGAALAAQRHDDPEPWFICHTAGRSNIIAGAYADQQSQVTLTFFDTASGLAVSRQNSVAHEIESGSGLSWPLQQNGVTVGAIFELVMGAGVAQGEDYTEPVTGFSLGSEDRACRWRPRTRFSGFSAHHFYQISEDGPRNDNLQAVPLRLEIFDFGAQGDGPSLEVHGGRDQSTMTLERLTFDAGAMHYELRITNGPAVMEAAHNGARAWSETILAYKTGPQDNSGD